jgi:hypothetical protein
VADFGSWIYQFPGPVTSKVFLGNKDLARSYEGLGANLLFHVKSIMRQGQIDSYGLTRTLEDGTIINASSMFGMDRITIESPFFPKVTEKKEGELRIKLIADDTGLPIGLESLKGFRIIFPADRDPFPASDNHILEPCLIFEYDEQDNFFTIRHLREATVKDFWGNDVPGWDWSSPDFDLAVPFEPDMEFWLEYWGAWPNVTEGNLLIKREFKTTQYQGIQDPGQMTQEKDLISPDDYVDTVHVDVVEELNDSGVYIFNVTDAFGNAVDPSTVFISVKREDGYTWNVYGNSVAFTHVNTDTHTYKFRISGGFQHTGQNVAAIYGPVGPPSDRQDVNIALNYFFCDPLPAAASTPIHRCRSPLLLRFM